MYSLTVQASGISKMLHMQSKTVPYGDPIDPWPSIAIDFQELFSGGGQRPAADHVVVDHRSKQLPSQVDSRYHKISGAVR